MRFRVGQVKIYRACCSSRLKEEEGIDQESDDICIFRAKQLADSTMKIKLMKGMTQRIGARAQRKSKGYLYDDDRGMYSVVVRVFIRKL